MLISTDPIKPFTIDQLISMFDPVTEEEKQPKPVQQRKSRWPISLSLGRILLPKEVKDQIATECQVRIEVVESVKELFNYITKHGKNIQVIIIGAWQEVYAEAKLSIIEVITAVRTLIHCTGRDIKLAVGINSQVDNAVVQEIRRMPIDYFWPGSGEFSAEEKIETMQAMLEGRPFTCARLEAMLKPQRRAKNKPTGVNLTPRQNQIMEIIAQRGASNKVIARMLGITESTVKLHMSGILKKYGVRNRTQLALFVRDKAQV